MDLARFSELYASEAREHLRLLSRGLLAIETAGSAAVDEAFRAAHTLKGLGATMNFDAVTALAHALEDRLDSIRANDGSADAATVDALLALADRLEIVVADSIAGRAPSSADAATPPVAARAGPASRSAVQLARPDTLVVRVRIRHDAPIKAARALLILRALESVAEVLDSDPTEFDADFDGELTLWLPATAERGAVEQAVRGAGDVEAVSFAQWTQGTQGTQGTPAAEGVQAPHSDAAAHSDEAARARRAALAGEPSEDRTSLRSAAVSPGRQIRVDQGRLDELADWIGELAVLQTRLGTRGETEPPSVAHGSESATRMGRLVTDLRTAVQSMRMVPVSDGFERFPRVVRDVARATGREVDYRLEGGEIELDRALVQEMVDPLVHLLRNAVDHGIEAAERRVAAGKPPRGTLVLRVERERSSVRLTLADDGRGVARDRVHERAAALGLARADEPSEPGDAELFRLLSHPGFSTAASVTEVSGRGVGLDAVVNRVRAIGGAIEMRSRTGEGTTFTIRLPLTLALAHALLVRVGGESYAMPLTHVAEAVDLEDVRIENGGPHERLIVRGAAIPLIRLGAVLQSAQRGAERAAVLTGFGDRRAALAVDALLGTEQIMVKPFAAAAGTLPIFSGVTLLADGRPALVLDPLSVL